MNEWHEEQALRQAPFFVFIEAAEARKNAPVVKLLLYEWSSTHNTLHCAYRGQ